MVRRGENELEEDLRSKTDKARAEWATKCAKDDIKAQYEFVHLEVGTGIRKFSLRCKQCGPNDKLLTYNAVQATTTNLRLHLQRKHKEIWQELRPGEQVP